MFTLIFTCSTITIGNITTRRPPGAQVLHYGTRAARQVAYNRALYLLGDWSIQEVYMILAGKL